MTRISNKCSLVTSNDLQYFRFFHRFIVMTARDSHEFLKFAGPLWHHHLVLIHRLIDSGHTFEDKLCVLSFVPAPAAWPWRQRIAQHDLRSGAWKAAGSAERGAAWATNHEVQQANRHQNHPRWRWKRSNTFLKPHETTSQLRATCITCYGLPRLLNSTSRKNKKQQELQPYTQWNMLGLFLQKKRLKPPDFSIHQSPTSTRASSLKCNTQTPANLSSDMTLAAGPTQQLVHGLCISSAWCRACCRNPDLVIVESMAKSRGNHGFSG